jgi:hypothetical protein
VFLVSFLVTSKIGEFSCFFFTDVFCVFSLIVILP